MRIAILSSRFPPRDIGGAEIAAYNIAKKMSEKGHEVHVITRKQPEAARNGFNVREIRYISRPPFLRYLTTALAMVKELVQIKPDIVYCESLFSESLAGVIASKLLGFPVVTRPVGEIYVYKSKADSAMMRFIIKNSTLVLAMTAHMKKEVLKYNRNAKVDVLHDGVDYDFFRQYPGAKPKPFSILYVGRLNRLKCIDCLLKAFGTVEKKMPGATLTLIGEGEQSAKLRRLAKELRLKKAFFMGIQKRDVVARHMKSSSMLVLPSLSEGFPLVIAEAMAAGLPIITTRIRGLPEIITDGENGYLVEPERPAQLAEKIISLLENGEARKRFGANNIRKSEKYKWDVIVGDLLRIFKGLTGRLSAGKDEGKGNG
jgi:glycosyltransferase involved in cell wall biosynthesis